jgi:L-fuconate dehydratase
MAHDDEKVRTLIDRAIGQGFRAPRKVGSADESVTAPRRHAARTRRRLGIIMFDANQQWSLAGYRMGRKLAEFRPLWLEEPTHPMIFRPTSRWVLDCTVRLPLAAHSQSRLFKNFLQLGALSFA